MSDKKKIIMGADTGSDDAIALMTALRAPELSVIGITAVNGNKPVENTTENTLRVADLLDTYMTLTAYGESAEEALTLSKDRIKELEALWPVTDENSDIYKVELWEIGLVGYYGFSTIEGVRIKSVKGMV